MSRVHAMAESARGQLSESERREIADLFADEMQRGRGRASGAGD